eukprot:TRINITY_DN8324_c0_g1_i6.p1 TRINITY_DN8324_c0_g1~~TRINITY_DN8324_c0_g1_i6.p1  ORF type:complete len:1340 (+),score=121.92 TRINITY_DN8324_c0_g1_i6:78-4022(+)
MRCALRFCVAANILAGSCGLTTITGGPSSAIACPTNDDCRVDCVGKQVCKNAWINPQPDLAAGHFLHLRCIGEQSCDELRAALLCHGAVSPGGCAVECSGVQACKLMKLSCPDPPGAAQCGINCMGPTECDSAVCTPDSCLSMTAAWSPPDYPSSPSASPIPGLTAHPTFGPTIPPSRTPTTRPTRRPTAQPSLSPTIPPTPFTPPTDVPMHPTRPPSTEPTAEPTAEPTTKPTGKPTANPTAKPTTEPTMSTAEPTTTPTTRPTAKPTTMPTAEPTTEPTVSPTTNPAVNPTAKPTTKPTAKPTTRPTTRPTTKPTANPTENPVVAPTVNPTTRPTTRPTAEPTENPIAAPTAKPTADPARLPSRPPTGRPSMRPSAPPTAPPSADPASGPTGRPTAAPTAGPSKVPSSSPSAGPALGPTPRPSPSPSLAPSAAPFAAPSVAPSTAPRAAPSAVPALGPTPSPGRAPTARPTALPTTEPLGVPSPTPRPTARPTPAPHPGPTARPTLAPRTGPTAQPTLAPHTGPTTGPTLAPHPGPTAGPTRAPGTGPTANPTEAPGPGPPAGVPTRGPSTRPTQAPSRPPVAAPTRPPTRSPTVRPSTTAAHPTPYPSAKPQESPSAPPEAPPAPGPSRRPSRRPLPAPTPATTGPSRSLTKRPATPSSPTSAPVPPALPGAPSAAPSARPARWRPPSFAPLLPFAPLPTRSPLPLHLALGSEAPRSPPTAGPTASRQQQRQALHDAAGGAVATAEAVSRVAGPAGSRVAILLVLNCLVDDLDLEENERIDLEFHPLRAPLGSHHQRYFVGAIFFNTLITVAVTLALCAAVIVRGRMHGGRGIPMDVNAQAAFRFPSFPFIPYEYLAQGTALSAANCAFFPSRGAPGTQLLGIFTLFALASSLPLIWWRCLSGAHLQATVTRDHWMSEREGSWGPWRRRAYHLVYGRGVWASMGVKYTERYGLLFESYGPGKEWWLIPEVGHLIVIALFAAWRPGDRFACDARNFLVTGMLLLYLMGLIYSRPFLSPLVLMLQAAVAGFNVLGTALIAAGLAAGDHPGLLRGGAATLVVSAFSQFVLLVSEILAYCIDLCVGRRQRGWDSLEQQALFSVGSALQTPKESLCSRKDSSSGDELLPSYRGEDEPLGSSEAQPAGALLSAVTPPPASLASPLPPVALKELRSARCQSSPSLIAPDAHLRTAGTHSDLSTSAGRGAASLQRQISQGALLGSTLGQRAGSRVAGRPAAGPAERSGLGRKQLSRAGQPRPGTPPPSGRAVTTGPPQSRRPGQSIVGAPARRTPRRRALDEALPATGRGTPMEAPSGI